MLDTLSRVVFLMGGIAASILFILSVPRVPRGGRRSCRRALRVVVVESVVIRD